VEDILREGPAGYGLPLGGLAARSLPSPCLDDSEATFLAMAAGALRLSGPDHTDGSRGFVLAGYSYFPVQNRHLDA
jgi:hypothetical protein